MTLYEASIKIQLLYSNQKIVLCPVCSGMNVIKHEISENGKQRYYCKDATCKGKSFQLEHSYTGCKVGINEKIVAMAANASGIRDTSRVLGVSQKKVMSTLKNKRKDKSYQFAICSSAADVI